MIRTGTPADLNFQPKSIAFSVIKDLPSYLVAEPDPAAHRAGADCALSCSRKGPHDATGDLRHRQCRPHHRDRQDRRDRPQAHRRRIPLRRQGLLHPLRQLHLPGADRQFLRRGIRHLRHRAPNCCRPSSPSATPSSAAPSWPGSGTLCHWPTASLGSTANSTPSARPSPTAATCRACRRCASAAAPIGEMTTGSSAWACCTPSRRPTSRSSRRRPTVTIC